MLEANGEKRVKPAVHCCKHCACDLHSYILCAAVWMPKEGYYFCSSKCIKAYNSKLLHVANDVLPKEECIHINSPEGNRWKNFLSSNADLCPVRKRADEEDIHMDSSCFEAAEDLEHPSILLTDPLSFGAKEYLLLDNDDHPKADTVQGTHQPHKDGNSEQPSSSADDPSIEIMQNTHLPTKDGIAQQPASSSAGETGLSNVQALVNGALTHQAMPDYGVAAEAEKDGGDEKEDEDDEVVNQDVLNLTRPGVRVKVCFKQNKDDNTGLWFGGLVGSTELFESFTASKVVIGFDDGELGYHTLADSCRHTLLNLSIAPVS